MILHSQESGVYGVPQSKSGVYDLPQSQSGVYDLPQSGSGVYGLPQSGSGVYGLPQSESGVYGLPPSESGVYGLPQSESGVYGLPKSGSGVYGIQQSASQTLAVFRRLMQDPSSAGICRTLETVTVQPRMKDMRSHAPRSVWLRWVVGNVRQKSIGNAINSVSYIFTHHHQWPLDICVFFSSSVFLFCFVLFCQTVFMCVFMNPSVDLSLIMSREKIFT